MSRNAIFKEDLELTQLRETEQRLLQMEKEISELPRKLAEERLERETTMPPHPEIADRKRRKHHDELVSRGAVANVRRTQNRSLTLTLMLLVATASLIWWSIKIMHG